MQKSKPLPFILHPSSFILFSVCALLWMHAANAATARHVAVTFDDLPDLSEDEHTVEQSAAMMNKLISAIARARVPAIGFVNEEKLLDETNKANDPRLVALLDAWLASGFDLGNHTFVHVDLHKVGVEPFEADIARGEVVTRTLAEKYHRPLKWFRHPYLNTGRTLADRAHVEAFLAAHGYEVAPVTIDNSEWIYALAYERATSPLLRWRVRNAYVRYMKARFAWYETRAHALFGREIKQIVLLHADTLNADAFPRLLRMMRRRGYRFITVDEAMTDPAYRSPDKWTEDGGVSWIERWGVTRGVSQALFDRDPPADKWILKLADVKEE
jgi:peptidoglycan/xylan/chitin deacetylase (PgdA/CDA1 family)